MGNWTSDDRPPTQGHYSTAVYDVMRMAATTIASRTDSTMSTECVYRHDEPYCVHYLAAAVHLLANALMHSGYTAEEVEGLAVVSAAEVMTW